MDFLLIALLTLLNGLFAMSELALASSRKLRLQSLADAGDRGARQALALLADPTQFLSSVQVGITSIGMVNGIVGEAAFSADLGQWLLALGVPHKAAELSATALVVVLITFITIVFGELVPKRIGQLYPEQVARLVARPMAALARVAGPFVRLLALSTRAVLGLLRIDNTAARAVTEEEIAASLNEGHEAGVIEDEEHQLLQNVFRLDDRPLTSLMVPRSDVQWLDADMSVAQALRLAGSEGGRGAHSWYPVCEGSLDEVLGVVGVAQLLSLENAGALQLRACVQPAHFLPETLSGLELLEQLRRGAGRFVFVVDEYGVVQGIMTPRDLLEAITGELLPNAHSEAWALQRDDGSWLLDGQMPITELKARLEIRDLPGQERGRYNTLAGLLLTVCGHLPALGERITCAAWVFEIVDLDGRRIDKVLAQPVTATAP